MALQFNNRVRVLRRTSGVGQLSADLPLKYSKRVLFSGLKADLEAAATQKQLELTQGTLNRPLVSLGKSEYTGLQLLELANSFTIEAKNNPAFKSFGQWLFSRPTMPGLFDLFSVAGLLHRSALHSSDTLDQTKYKLKEAYARLRDFGFIACPDKINSKDGYSHNLWVLTDKGAAALRQSQLGLDKLSLKAESGFNELVSNAGLELTAKQIRWFTQSFGQHGLSGLNLADRVEAATRKKGWFSSNIYHQPIALNRFLSGFSAQKEVVKAALLEMETLGLLTRSISGSEPTIALSEVGMKLINQLQGKDVMKVSADTFQMVIRQEIAERKDAIAKLEQDMLAWGEKIKTMEKELLLQDVELSNLRRVATLLAVKLEATFEPLGSQKVNEKLKESVLALRFAEVKTKAEASHLQRLTQRYDTMKTAFKRWELAQMTQMQRLMEMQKELELRVGFDQVSERLRGQTAQSDQDFNALFQALLKLDQEGVIPTGSIQDVHQQDQAASVQQGVDRALLEMEQLGMVEGFLKEVSDKSASEAQTAVKKAQS